MGSGGVARGVGFASVRRHVLRQLSHVTSFNFHGCIGQAPPPPPYYPGPYTCPRQPTQRYPTALPTPNPNVLDAEQRAGLLGAPRLLCPPVFSRSASRCRLSVLFPQRPRSPGSAPVGHAVMRSDARATARAVERTPFACHPPLCAPCSAMEAPPPVRVLRPAHGCCARADASVGGRARRCAQKEVVAEKRLCNGRSIVSPSTSHHMLDQECPSEWPWRCYTNECGYHGCCCTRNGCGSRAFRGGGGGALGKGLN